MRLRGTIEEIGAERAESVSLAARNAMGSAASSALTAIPRAIGVTLGLLFAPLRMLLIPSLLGGRRTQNGPDQLQIPITPFVVTSDEGTTYDCVIRGEMRGGFLKLGEAVEVSGRIDGSRVLRVDAVTSLRTGAVTRGRIDPRIRAARAQTIAGVLFLIMLILILVGLIQTFGR